VGASPGRGPGISGLKAMRRSVVVWVPPPGCSYRVAAGSSTTVPPGGGSTSIWLDTTMSWCTRIGTRPRRSATRTGSGSTSRKLPPLA